MPREASRAELLPGVGVLVGLVEKQKHVYHWYGTTFHTLLLFIKDTLLEISRVHHRSKVQTHLIYCCFFIFLPL